LLDLPCARMKPYQPSLMIERLYLLPIVSGL
jgi:hypothetical protein